jgi:nucleotide-binding universal stress UspA family protein
MATMRIESVLVGMDFSASAVRAAQWVARFFAPNAAMTLVHVIDPPDRPPFASPFLPSPDEVIAAAREDAELRMSDVVASLSTDLHSKILIGKPHERIREFGESIGADLVVVGPHGDRPRPHMFLGTTAERIVRVSSIPVLVGTNPPVGAPRTILVPVDYYRLTETILQWARDLAGTFGAEVKLLHVWSTAIYSHVASMSRLAATSDAEARREVEKELRDAATRWLEDLTATGFEHGRATATVMTGKPGDATLELATATHADLILLGRHGSGLVAPALFGSVVRTVLNGASCPVLVVTEPRDT